MVDIPLTERQTRAAPPPPPRETVRGHFRISRREETMVEYQADLPAIMSVLEGAGPLDRSSDFARLALQEQFSRKWRSRAAIPG